MRFPQRPRILPFLNLVKLILALVAVLMFMQFNFKLADQQAITRKIAQSTNNVVKSQADILKAIKEVTDDTHTTAAQQTAIIICMLQVPVEERTTDLQAQCRAQSKAVSSDGSASRTGSNVPNTSPAESGQSVSSPQSAPTTSTSTANTPHPARSTAQKVEDFSAKVIDAIWPFN